MHHKLYAWFMQFEEFWLIKTLETITVRLFLFIFLLLVCACVHMDTQVLLSVCTPAHTHLWSPIDSIIYLKELE